MSRQQALSAMIHIRDFVDTIASDATRADTANRVEILTEVNVFEEDGFSNPSSSSKQFVPASVPTCRGKSAPSTYLTPSSTPTAASPLLCLLVASSR